MNRNHRLALILKTLLLPLVEESFCSADLIARRAASLGEYRDNPGQRRQQAGAYRELTDRLIGCVAGLAAPDRLDDVAQLLEAFYPSRKVLKNLTGRQTGCRADLYYLSRVLDVSESFITLRDGRLSIRLDEIPGRDALFGPYSGLNKPETWNMLCRIATPDIFMAGYFVAAGIGDIRQLAHLAPNLSLPDALLGRVLGRGMAETHLHAGAGMSYQSVWEQCTDFTRFLNWDFAQEKPAGPWEGLPLQIAAGVLRLMMAGFLESGAAGRTGFLHFYKHNPFQSNEACSNRLGQGKNGEGHGREKDGGEGPGQEKLGWERCTLQAWVLGDARAEWRPWWDFLVKNKLNFYSHFFNSYPLLAPGDGHSPFDLLGRSVYRKYRGLCTSDEMLFLYKSLVYLKTTREAEYARVFFQYLRLKNLFFQRGMQTPGALGLRYFQRFYNRAAAAPYAGRGEGARFDQYYALFCDQGKIPGLQRLELKISPRTGPRISTRYPDEGKLRDLGRGICRQLLQVFRAYLKYLRDYGWQRQGKGFAFPNIGIVYHFIKAEDLGRAAADICWNSEMDERMRESDFTEVRRWRMMEFLDALVPLLRDIPYLNEYVVGIDAASDELGMEPWVFAPVFRYARRRQSTYPRQLDTDNPIQNLGLTYHVGEDYRHLLSGMRHVDEVLTHFGYKAGDRLGHALAVQVDPHGWQQENETVALPEMEYLEDLLWLQDLSSREPEIKACVPLNLESKIMELAKRIYGNIIGITPHTLWRAYNRKFGLLGPELLARMRVHYLPQDAGGIPQAPKGGELPPGAAGRQRCFCQRYQSRPGIDHVWDEEKLLLTHFCPIYLERYGRPIFVQVPKNLVELLCRVQEYLKRRIQKAGIFVETNPTSNATIGDIEGMAENPVLGLNSKGIAGGGAYSVLLSINSDDPLVFGTNVENEFANTYYMLISRGYSREEVLDWIDKVRQFGIDSSFIRQAKAPGQLERELTTLCAALEAHLNWPAQTGKEGACWNAFYPGSP